MRQEDGAADAGLAACAGLGGECVFLGRTRAELSDSLGPLVALEYEAYSPMAIGVITRIAQDAARECDCGFVAVRHSVGVVPVGEASVLIRVISAHRNEAFVACRMIIDRLKREAPIWKREQWERGATWQEGAPATGGAPGAEDSAQGRMS